MTGLCLLPGSVPAALLLGAGTNLDGATGREGTGTRLNIDDYHTQSLSAGTYTIENFEFLARVQNSTDATSGGSVVPFLAIHNGTNYQIIWRGTPTDVPTNLTGNQSAVVSGSTAGSFTLASDAVVYSGFYTQGVAAVAYNNTYANPRTDHANTTSITNFAINSIGAALTGISLSDQNRSYAQSISVQATNNLRIGPGLNYFLGADSAAGERLNIDRSKAITLGQGTHTLTSFSFFSTLAPETSLSGSVTPFLAKQTGANQFEVVWVGSAVQNSVLGGNEATLNSSLTLAEETTLYAGFYSSGGARVAFQAITNGDPGTAHSSGTSYSTATGNVLNFPSNGNLNRVYSFELLIAAVPEPSKALLIFAGLCLTVTIRRSRC
jgi:hypothetical protein